MRTSAGWIQTAASSLESPLHCERLQCDFVSRPAAPSVLTVWVAKPKFELGTGSGRSPGVGP